MSQATNPGRALDVVIAGGGVAGLETALALRALAGSRVRITLVTPEREFVYRPLSVAEPFGAAPAERHDLDRIANDLDVDLVHDRLDWVAPGGQVVFLGSGTELPYDALVVALGARPEPAWPDLLTFRGPADVAAMAGLVDELARGTVASAAFVVPTGVTWPLPLYELALMSATRAAAAGASPEIAVFTRETEPLAVFGAEAARSVAAELDAAGIRVARSASFDVTPENEVVIPDEEITLRFERVVAVPRLSGPAPRGLPHDESGFIPIDSHGVVHGAKHVYAAGDGTDYPVKQGGIAAQQAEAVAEVIAKRAGARIDPRPFPAVLRAQLFTGRGSRFLRTDLAFRASHVSEASEKPLWWPAGKIAGARLGSYLAAVEERAAEPVTAGSVDAGLERTVPVTSYVEESPYGE